MSKEVFGYIELHAVDHCNNNCRWCNNHAPLAPEREYRAEEYFPWLDILEQKKVGPEMLSVMGGEPFLHGDLARFVLDLRTRYPSKNLAVSTNGFWLDQNEIDSYGSLWKLVDVLFLSLYPNLLRDKDPGQDVDALVARIKGYNPQMHVRLRRKQEFMVIEYPEEPREPRLFCNVSECTTLLTDGRLARCGLGGYAYLNANVGGAFVRSRDMFFDLKRDFLPLEFWNWRRRWPLDACLHCTYPWREMSAWKAEKGTRRREDLEIEHALRCARRLLAMERPRQAGALFERIVAGHPDCGPAHSGFAVSVYQENPSLALEHLVRALDIDPDDALARQNLQVVRRMLRAGTH